MGLWDLWEAGLLGPVDLWEAGPLGPVDLWEEGPSDLSYLVDPHVAAEDRHADQDPWVGCCDQAVAANLKDRHNKHVKNITLLNYL